MGLEPTTLGTTIQCSNQLSYIHHLNDLYFPLGNPDPKIHFFSNWWVKDGTRTHDPWNHNPML